MSVSHLKTIRLITIALICAMPAVALLFIPKPWWLVLLAAMLALFLVQRRLLGLMMRRLNHIAFSLLDPELLKAESEEFYRILRRPSTKKNLNYVYLYESLRHDLNGDYGMAVDEAMKVAFGQAGPDEGVKWDLIQYHARAGRLPMAEALLKQLGSAGAEQAQAGRPMRLHTLGLLRLEKGDFKKAEALLLEALKSAKRNLTMLKCSYDLGRLYEKTGVAEKAVEHRKRAAALGPKTWMGREAAKTPE